MFGQILVINVTKNLYFVVNTAQGLNETFMNVYVYHIEFNQF